ncbi:MAG: ATP-binding cassette domain-containing protein [Dysosmobacter sp.]
MNKGDFVTVIGSNGAGKSTLFNAIAGSFYVDDGAITVGGQDMTFLPEYKRSQAASAGCFRTLCRGLRPNMTIEENLALAYLRAAHGDRVFSRIDAEGPELFPRPAGPAGHGTGGPAEPAR